MTAPAPAGDYPGKTLGLVALIVSIFASVIGIILGFVARNQSKQAGYENPLAKWAIIVGFIMLAIGIIFGIVYSVVIASALQGVQAY